MRILTEADIKGTRALLASQIVEIMLEEDDGTVRFPLDDRFTAGMQLAENPLDDPLEDGDEWAFYDFLLDNEEKTVQFNEETTGAFSLEQIEMLVEYRLTQILDHID
jgi:hypothetical protein